MSTVQVDLGDRSYPIYIGSGLLGQKELFSRHIVSKQVLVVTNTTVGSLYLQQLLKSLDGYQVETIELPDGEIYKTLKTTETVFDTLIEKRFNRDATLIALGGGVVGDIAGFAAACYQRGIPFIQVPTTLLAQVDSSVGGKTGVNHPGGKNMIGAFYQPRCVVTDTSVLSTLDNRQLRAGIAEVIKYGLIRDPQLFGWLETNMDRLLNREAGALAFAIERSCINKSEIVAEDENETGIRAILNLGHTFGHAIETGMGYGTYLHGEAVSIGICLAADLSQRRGWLNDSEIARITDILNNANLPTESPRQLTVDRFLELMAVDKKNLDGRLRLVLLKAIGEAIIVADTDTAKLEATLMIR